MLNTNSAAIAKAAAPAAASPICHFVPLMTLDNFPLDRMARCYLPLNNREELLTAFGAAPQFSDINPVTLLNQQPDGLRVILLTESDYYARQAAAYLAALSAGDDAADARFYPLDALPADMAFDHARILGDFCEVVAGRRQLAAVEPL